MATGITRNLTEDMIIASKYELTADDDILIISGSTITLDKPAGDLFTNEGNDTVTVTDSTLTASAPGLGFYLGSGDDTLRLQNSTIDAPVLTGSGNDTVTITSSGQSKVTLNQLTEDTTLNLGSGDDILELHSILDGEGDISFGEGRDTLRFDGGSLLITGAFGTFSVLDVMVAGGVLGRDLTLAGTDTGIILNGAFFGSDTGKVITIADSTTALTTADNIRTDVTLNLSNVTLTQSDDGTLEFSGHTGYAVTANNSTVTLHDIVTQSGQVFKGENTIWYIKDCAFANSTVGIELTGGSIEMTNVEMANYESNALRLNGTKLTGAQLAFTNNSSCVLYARRDDYDDRGKNCDIDITDVRMNNNRGKLLDANYCNLTLTDASVSGNTAKSYMICLNNGYFTGDTYRCVITNANFLGNICEDSMIHCGSYNDHYLLSITNANFSGNVAKGGPYDTHGGAVWHGSSEDFIITSANFFGNIIASAGMGAYGGAIAQGYCDWMWVKGDCILTSVNFSGNTAAARSNAYGGGAYVKLAPDYLASLNSTKFYGNVAVASDTSQTGAEGGGLFIAGYEETALSYVTMDEVEFHGNVASAYGSSTASAEGGGIYLENVNANIRHASFSGNIAKAFDTTEECAYAYGGAIYSKNSILNLSDTVFCNNRATVCSGYGGALYIESTTLTYTVSDEGNIVNHGNQATTDGGFLTMAGMDCTANFVVGNDAKLTLGDTDSICGQGLIQKQGAGYLLINGEISGYTGLWTVYTGTLELAQLARTINLDNWTFGEDALVILSSQNDTINMTANKKISTLDLGGGNDVINTHGYSLSNGELRVSKLKFTGGGRVSTTITNRNKDSGFDLTLDDVILDSTIAGKNAVDQIAITANSTLGGAIDLGNGNNIITATAQALFKKTLTTGNGNDTLSFAGVTFEDSVSLGDGDNSLTATAQALFKKTLTTENGNDTLSFAGVTFEDNVSLGDGDNSLTATAQALFKKTLTTGNGNDTLAFAGVTFEDNVSLGNGDNSLTATAQALFKKTLTTGNGNDTLAFTGGTFTGDVELGDGTNSLNVTSISRIVGKLTAGTGNDTLRFETVTFNGSVTLGDGMNSISVTNATFKNTLTTGDGNDTLSITEATFSDKVDLGDGNDTLTFGSSSTNSGGVTAGQCIDLGDGDNSITVYGTSEFVGLTGGSGSDTLDLRKESTISGELDLGGGQNVVYVGNSLTMTDGAVKMTHGGETRMVVYRGTTLTDNTLTVYADANAERETTTYSWANQTELDKVRLVVSSDSTFETFEFAVELYNKSKTFTLNMEKGYFVQFQANDEDGWKQRLVNDAIAPNQVTGVEFNGRTLTWDVTRDNLGGNGVKQYTVEVATDSSFTALVDTHAVTETEYTPTGLGDGTYYFRVCAEDFTQNIGEWSTTVSGQLDQTPPTRPTGGQGSVNGYNVTFSWNAATDTGSGVAEYEYRIASDSGYSTIVRSDRTASLTLTENALAYGNYYWQVRAIDQAGNVGEWSLSKSVKTQDLIAPTTPGNVDYGVEASTVSVLWDASQDDALGSGIKDYEIQLSNDSSFDTIVKSVSVTETEAVLSSLADGDYYMRVAAVDKTGNRSIWSDVMTFTIENATPSIIRATRGDFDGNGISDILFQNLTDAANPLGAWMNADKWQWNGSLGPAAKSDWTVYGAFDFTGDGVCDIMFRSKLASTQYAVGYYDMGNGGKFETMGWGVTAEWELANVGDFNGNGTSDILWKNTDNGYLGLWMDGTDQWVGLPASALGAGQSIIGMGDVNNDGCDDILINSNGVLGAWDITGIIEGTAGVPAWSSFGITVSSDWETIGCADFDGNGKADIVLWNDNGYIGTYMNCDGSDFRAIYPSASKDEWGIPGFGDYDGDGSEDVLVRNLASGALGYWDGNDDFTWHEIGCGVDSTWAVIA